ncbi:MAG: peptide chain release factor N(5)-glutamine methyltransferase [Armatimonadetes bacterium]|nr:peptide chain release factor N(5)-glutamine methyltransferase [Armatimonadota bacterium]
MTIKELLANASVMLDSLPAEERSPMVLSIASQVCKKTIETLYAHPNEPVTQEQWRRIRRGVREISQGKPLAYVLGVQPFLGLPLYVSKDVLIPRPETEILAEKAITLVRGRACPLTVVDVGTGSGCIILAIAKAIKDDPKLAGSALFAVDASARALQIARKNARFLELSERIRFLKGNLLEPITTPVDLLVSNPPYVGEREIPFLPPALLAYEPKEALIAGPEGHEVLEVLLRQAGYHLAPDGVGLIEIGYRQGETAIKLARAHFPDGTISIAKDLSGNDRILELRR